MCLFDTGFSRLEVPKQALVGIPLGLGMVVKKNLLNFHAHAFGASCTWQPSTRTVVEYMDCI